MRKVELANLIGREFLLTRKTSLEIIDRIFAEIFGDLARGGRVELRRIGVFTIRRLRGYKSSIRTVSNRNVVKFKASKFVNRAISKRTPPSPLAS